MRRWSFPARIAAVICVAALLVHTAGWWWLSRQVRDGYRDWVATMGAQGVAVSGGVPTLAGWPLAGGIDVPDVRIDGPGWQWTTARLGVSVRPWQPDRLRVAPATPQSFVSGGTTLAVDAADALVTLTLPAGDRPAVAVSGLSVTTPAGRVTIEHAGGTLDDTAPQPRLTVGATGVVLPPGPAYLLGPAIAAIDLDATTDRALPTLHAPALAAWRDAGGTVRIGSMRLRWGTLALDATGTAALDRALQPLADLRVAMTGQDAALEAAVSHGLIQPRAAGAVRAVLALLAGAQPSGGTIPVSLRDGSVAVAGFPVARLPPVAWPP